MRPGFARQRRVEVELFNQRAAILHLAVGKDRQAFEQLLGFLAAMRFHETDDHIDPFPERRFAGRQHRIGFADAGAGAEKYLQLAAAAGLRGGFVFLGGDAA